MTNFETILKKELTKLKQQIVANLKRQGTDISPKTEAKINIVVTTFSGAIYVPFWFPVFEKGRGPRKSTQNYELWKIIKAWGIKKGIIQAGPGADAKAKSLTWWINKHGTKLYRTKGYRDIYNTLIIDFASDIMQQLSMSFMYQVSSEINKSINK